MSRRFNEPWTREDYEDMVIDMVQERLEDDALYPQIYLEQIARHDYSIYGDFVADMLKDLGNELIAECEQNGFSKLDITITCLKELHEVFRWWDSLSAEEQKETIDIEELDKIRAEHCVATAHDLGNGFTLWTTNK